MNKHINKILCFTDGLSLGGAERQLIGLAYFLQTKGYDVELLSYLKRDFYNELISSYKIKSVCLDIKGGRISKFWAVLNYIRRGNYDCVIAYKDGATFSACVAKMLGLKYKLIVSERNTNLSRNRHDDFRFLLYSVANYIVPNSYSQKKFIIDNYPRLKNRVVAITNFTDTNYFKQPVQSVDSCTIVKIMVAARIAEQKNIFRFLEVVRRLKEAKSNFQVVWYGNASFGEDDYEKKCRKLIEEYNIDDVFTFQPATKNILGEYQNCDVFCLPSLYEGYPNALCEAMSCGKPILCSNVCDNPLIVEDTVNGFMFNPTDIDEMFISINKFIGLPPEEKKKMGKISRELAEKKFSEEVFIQKYIELIESK